MASATERGAREATAEAVVRALEARLRARPDDAEAARVYADALIASGDARGELILLQRRLALATDAQTASALDQRQVALLGAYGDAILQRPGGFPFRERYGPRGFLRYGEDADLAPGSRASELTLDADPGLATFRRVRRLLERLTNARGPQVVNLYGLVALEQVVEGDLKGLPSPATELLIGFMELLGPGEMREHSIWTAAHPPPTAQHAAWERFVRDWEATPILEQPIGLELTYRFRMTFPDRDELLPFQDAIHYDNDRPLESVLVTDLASATVRLHLCLPFESASDPRGVVAIEALEQELGPLRRAMLVFSSTV